MSSNNSKLDTSNQISQMTAAITEEKTIVDTMTSYYNCTDTSQKKELSDQLKHVLTPIHVNKIYGGIACEPPRSYFSHSRSFSPLELSIHDKDYVLAKYLINELDADILLPEDEYYPILVRCIFSFFEAKTLTINQEIVEIIANGLATIRPHTNSTNLKQELEVAHYCINQPKGNRKVTDEQFQVFKSRILSNLSHSSYFMNSKWKRTRHLIAAYDNHSTAYHT